MDNKYGFHTEIYESIPFNLIPHKSSDKLPKPMGTQPEVGEH